MKTNMFVNKDGWTFETFPRGFDLFSIPSELISKNDYIEIRLVKIAHSDGLVRHVYFVDKKDRNCLVTIAQLKTKHEAIEFMKKVS